MSAVVQGLFALGLLFSPPPNRRTTTIRCGEPAEFFSSRYGMSATEARTAEKKLLPNVVTSFPRYRAGQTCDALQTRLKLTDVEMRRILLRAPSITIYSNITVTAGLDFLQARLNLSDTDMRNIVFKHPSAVGYNAEPNMAALKHVLKLSDADLAKVVTRFPVSLGLSFDDNVAPTVGGLRRLLDLSDDELRKVVVARPSFLGLSFESNVQPALAALQERLGYETADVRRIVTCFPNLIGLSYENNVGPTLDALQTRLQLNQAELARLVLTLPQVLGYSFPNNMSPKLTYLQEAFGLSDAELKDRVGRLPSLLGYSIEKRYKKRAERCKAAGVPILKTLDTIALTDARFERALISPNRSPGGGRKSRSSRSREPICSAAPSLLRHVPPSLPEPDGDAAIELCRAWIEHHVIDHGLCPFAAKPFVAGKIRYAVTDATDDEGLVEAFFEEGRLILGEPEEELATTMLIAPNYKGGIEEFYWLYEWLVDTLEDESELELKNGVQPAFFHPDWSFDGLPADSAVHFEKRSPVVVINLLRRASLDAVVEAGLAAQPPRIVNKEIAEHNAMALERIGFQALSALFRERLRVK